MTKIKLTDGQMFLLLWGADPKLHGGRIYKGHSVPLSLELPDKRRISIDAVNHNSPSMIQMRGLVNRGFFDEERECFYAITDNGREAIKSRSDIVDRLVTVTEGHTRTCKECDRELDPNEACKSCSYNYPA